MLLSIVVLLYFKPIFAESVTVDAPQQSSSKPQAGSSAAPQAGGIAKPQTSQANSAGKKSATKQANNCTSTDSSITTSIKTNIATNDMVSSANIAVITESGVVRLIGSVNSEKEANTLVEISEAAKGVKDVDINKFTIKGNQKLSEDSAITSKIKGAIIREKLFDDKDIIKSIEAKTTNGIVVLTGTVANQSQVDKIVKLTQSIKGVNKVKSEIVVIEENDKK